MKKINIDFLPNESENVEKAALPGPGKYETIDTVGKLYRTKGKNNHAKSFCKNERFHRCTIIFICRKRNSWPPRV